jgi:ribonuclease P protein component
MDKIPLTGLKKRSQYLKIASTRIKCVRPGLILQIRKHSLEEVSSRKLSDLRLGFTVSKKVGNAVARNRVKRRLKAVARVILMAKSPKNLDLVIIGRQNTLKRPFSDLVTDLEIALKKIQLPKSIT